MLCASCTSLDFFGYADDSPLLVVGRPKGYKSRAFGAQLAATSSSSLDLIVVSGGRNTQTAVFTLGSSGAVSAPSSPDVYYPSTLGKAQDSGAGSALAGLPAWHSFDSETGSKVLVEGCFAVGEPSGSTPSVRVVCQGGEREADRLSLPSVLGEAVPPEEGFGLHLAAIRPAGGGGFLLAAGGDEWTAVYASGQDGDSTSAAYLAASSSSDRKLERLAGGRAELSLPWSTARKSRFFVAAGSTARGGAEERVQIFAENGSRLELLACVTREGELGFGGSMVAGDLDGDGNDELVVSASAALGRVERVYVYDVAALADQARLSPETCLGQATPLVIVSAPGQFEASSCDEGCGFGTALAIGDIATDDSGAELAVGAPGATAHGARQAGAVYLWRGALLTEGVAAAPSAYVVDSDAHKADALGSALAVAPIAGRSELVVGAPGASAVFVAFCTGLGEDIEQGADRTRNAKGKLVSTRCRLK
jgi:hypothetical protein